MEFLKIWEIIVRRRWIIICIFCIFVAVVVIGTHIVTPTYEAKAKVLIEKSDTLSSVMANLGIQDTGKGFIDTDEDYETDISMATIRPLIDKLISSLNLKDRDGKVMRPDDLMNWNLINKIFPQPYLKVDQYEGADMLEIVSNSTIPSEAANMSNKLAELYVKDRLERTREEFKAARIFIEQQLSKVKKEYYDSLSEVKDFMVKEVTVDLKYETQKLIEKINNLKKSYEENETATLELETEMVQVKKQLKEINPFRKESEEFSYNEHIKQLNLKLSDLLISIAEKSVDISEEHPEFKQLEKKIDTIKEIIKGENKVVFNRERYFVDPIYEDLSKKLVEGHINKEILIAKRKLFHKYIDEYQNELLRIPIKVAKNSKLELSLAVKEDMFENLLQYLLQIGIAESMTLSNIKLVEPAIEPDRPDYPKKPLNYALGVFLGLFWGLLVAFFKEYIDNTIKSPEDIKHIKSLNLLGTIPKTNSLEKHHTISETDPTSHIVEAFRTIRNSIVYASVDKPIKSITLTSAIDNEGKSSMAANLSILFAMEGRKVVLVGLDLRKPSLNKYFNITNNRGLTKVLSGAMLLEEAIIDSGVEGLDLLISGPIPPDPSRLIESKKMLQLIKELENMYDIAIIDSPPIIPVNDPIVLGGYSDSTILVIESSRATFSMIEHAKESINKAGINLVGVILNKFKIQYLGYKNYYYHGTYYKK